jgi:hypothetical protein
LARRSGFAKAAVQIVCAFEVLNVESCTLQDQTARESTCNLQRATSLPYSVTIFTTRVFSARLRSLVENPLAEPAKTGALSPPATSLSRNDAVEHSF